MKRQPDKQNIDEQYLNRVLSGAVDKVKLPSSLRGDALISLLDDIHVTQPVRKPALRLLSWQAAVTYAAAFVMIVAISTLVVRNNPSADIIAGQLEASPQSSSAEDMQSPEMESYDEPMAEMEVFDEAAMSPQMEAYSAPVEHGALRSSEPSTTKVDSDSDATAAPGIGGENKSIELGKDELYTYTYRINDETDPDKEGIPLTINVMHTSSGVLAFPIEVYDMLSINKYFSYNNSLTVIGEGTAGVVVRTYDLSQVGAASERMVVNQAGNFVSAKLHGNIVYVVTRSDNSNGGYSEMIALPEAASDDICVILAADIESAYSEQKAFVGADGDIAMSSSGVQISYSGEETDENPDGKYSANIKIDKYAMEIEE